MSAGEFGFANYFADGGDVCRVRIQPETLEATLGGNVNANVAGTVNQLATANATGTKGNGVFCRRVNVTFTGAPPAGYSPGGRASIVWLSKAGFDDIQKGDTGNYLGAPVRVTGKFAETLG